MSSDTYFYELGSRLFLETSEGTNPLQSELKAFGFGKRSGIQLPGEQAGLIPDAEVKKRLADRGVISEFSGRGYFIGDNVNLAIGQGLIGITPLQLANGYATFGNGGTLYQPRIVSTIYEPGTPAIADGRVDLSQAKVASVIAPVVNGQVEIPPEMAAPIIEGLRGVTAFETINGFAPTARDTFLGYDQNKIRVWGKTGTAQVDNTKDEKDTSLFAAWGAPEGEPAKYAIAAVIEEAGFGGQAAAPITRCLFEALANYTALLEPEQAEPLDRLQIVIARIPMMAPRLDASCLEIDFNQSGGRE